MEGCEYIIERVVSRKREECGFRGMLEACHLPACLCPPLTLCAMEATDIRPCEESCGEMLDICVCLTVQDSRGCRAEGTGIFKVQSGIRRPCGCAGLQVRRSVDICVRDASFCPPCGFFVCLSVVLETVFSRCELTGGAFCCPPKPACPPLPLYPPPCPPDACRGHFRQTHSQFPLKRVEEFPKMM